MYHIFNWLQVKKEIIHINDKTKMTHIIYQNKRDIYLHGVDLSNLSRVTQK